MKSCPGASSRNVLKIRGCRSRGMILRTSTTAPDECCTLLISLPPLCTAGRLFGPWAAVASHLKHAELPSRFLAHQLGGPRRIPDQFDAHVGRVGEAIAQHQFYFLGYHLTERTSGRGHRQRDIDSIRVMRSVINEPEIDDIDAEFGIDDRLQRSQDVIVHLTASLVHSTIFSVAASSCGAGLKWLSFPGTPSHSFASAGGMSLTVMFGQ